MRRVFSRVCTAGVLLVAACSRNAGPIEEFVGTYTLQTVNGHKLPATLPSSDGCSHSVNGGTLSLNQPAAATGPLFIWTAYVVKTCGGNGEEVVTPSPEMGEWSTDGEKISFDPKSGPNYDGVGYGAANSRSVEIQFGNDIYHFTNASPHNIP